MFEFQSCNPADYLLPSDIINFNTPFMQEKITLLGLSGLSEAELVKKAYEYVRDTFPHSIDITGEGVSITASDVIKNGHGICYAKSHLLAAILRSLGIPAGFCYQRLLLSEGSDRLVIHAVNAIYLKTLDKWIRLDARGNKQGVDAQFSVSEEKLAFPVRKELGEEDGFFIYTEPVNAVIAALKSSKNLSELIENLPESI